MISIEKYTNLFTAETAVIDTGLLTNSPSTVVPVNPFPARVQCRRLWPRVVRQAWWELCSPPAPSQEVTEQCKLPSALLQAKEQPSADAVGRVSRGAEKVPAHIGCRAEKRRFVLFLPSCH